MCSIWILTAEEKELEEVLTAVQKAYGESEQWVSVGKENDKGIPFYKGKGFAKQGEQKS